MAKTNLKLGSLGPATTGGPSSTSMGAITGGNPNTAMSDFAFDSVTVTQPYTYIVESTTEQLKFVFAQSGSRFNNYNKARAANYQVSVDNSVFFSTALNATAGIYDITAKGLDTAPYSGSSVTVLSAKYVDGFNINATGYNVASTKNIYSVDTYNSINTDSFCVDVATPILLANGTTVPAVDLYIGDVNKTYVQTDMPTWFPEHDASEWYWWYQTGSSGEVVDATIENIYYSFADSYISINNDLLKCTKAHPLFILDLDTNTYQFSRAEDLIAGDKLIKYNQTTNELEEILVENVDIINDVLEIATITVGVAHTYLANGFVSHNKGTESIEPIPYSGLQCYLDAQFNASYSASAQPVWNDLTGNATGFSLTGGTFGGVVAPTYSGTSPRNLTFAASKYGIKQPGYTTSLGSGFNLSKFNVTSATGMTIIAFLNSTSGIVLENSTNFRWEVYGNYALLAGGFAAQTSPQVSWGGWNMHAVTAGTGTTSFYRNSGTAYYSTAVGYTGGLGVSSYELKLMTNNTGAISNLFYYNRVLSSAEILIIYNNLKSRFGL
jgi:hypothetical protein